ncbi:MAG TPA: Coenzyme F420 hydrogenase/dehydrogenase, beta subunit C-terminal domain [Actinomycetota bacterium]|nr:Coenzyme F420 hydrogenase/dehydrogenase, beta subunit C-terminal domain [Actinomycetota bacterium]
MTPDDGERAYGQWNELYHEVVSTNLCTGCAACIMACPRDVLEYELASYHPFNVEDTTPFDDCIHGQRGCDICTKACPRFRVWEVECDEALFGRARRPDELYGIYRDILLVKANDEKIHEAGQDGGLVSALLIWGLEQGKIDGALVSKVSEERIWDAEPCVVTTREEVLATAGSRYTYAANPLAMKDAEKRGLRNLALVGMSCQASINGTLSARNVAKYRRRIGLTIGLLCSKSFTYEGAMVGKIQNELGIPLTDVAKVNVKGKFILWRKSTGEQVDIPLKEMHAFTREGCKLCPDFAAEHADISTGGLGQSDGWTLTIVRTERGSEWLKELVDAGWVTVRPGSEDPAAVALMGKLSAKQRKRWPGELPGDHAGPGLLPADPA